MVTKLNLSVRQANIQDKQQLANLIHFETLVHRHLDWRPPLEWFGHEPYLVLEKDSHLVAALICPPDPPSVAWIRIFAASSEVNLSEAWSLLWSRALDMISFDPSVFSAAIPLQPWFEKLLLDSEFQSISKVVMMVWESKNIPSTKIPADITLRPMNIDDLSAIEVLDNSAFGPLWHNSRSSLEYAYRQAAIATIAEYDGDIIGYQISTAMQMGGHLARLATHPNFQRKGIGSALLQDLQMQFNQRGALRLTVNTQEDNLPSISLYENAGFVYTGETYPVYQYPVK
jgi:ribosomal protein S18 acetylase RimI-like enzyme